MKVKRNNPIDAEFEESSVKLEWYIGDLKNDRKLQQKIT